MRALRGSFVVVVAFGPALAPAFANADRGAQLAATCAACHRLDDHGAGGPVIAGRPADEIVQQMKTFKTGESANHIMNAVSRSLSDEEIASVARYLSTIGKDVAP